MNTQKKIIAIEILTAFLVSSLLISCVRIHGTNYSINDEQKLETQQIHKVKITEVDMTIGKKNETEQKAQKPRTKTKKPGVSPEVLTMYEAREFKGMPYRLLKPVDFDPARTYPLILSLHGKGGAGTDNTINLRIWNGVLADEALRKKHPCFVLAPQTPGNWTNPETNEPVITEETIKDFPEAWQKFFSRRLKEQRTGKRKAQRSDLLRVFELVDEIAREFKIDRDRIYVLGHSMGGFGSWNAIWESPEMFAAAIPSAGGLPPWKNPEKFATIPIWAFHGTDDGTVPVEFTRELFEAMNKAGGNMKFTELPGVGHGASRVGFVYTGDDEEKGYLTHYSSEKCDRTEDVWEWLFNQKR